MKSLFVICFMFFLMGTALSQESKFQKEYFREAEPPPLIHPDDNWYQISLSNASFEDGTADYPSDWDRWGKGEFFWSREAFDGKRSAGLSKTDWSTGWRSPSFPVFADYQSDYPWYFCEAFIKTKGASGRIFLSIAWYGEKGCLGNSRSPYFLHPDSQEWYRLTLCALPPKGALSGEVILRVDRETTGVVLFDDVRLYSFSLPLVTSVGDELDSPYVSFLADYPSHPLRFYSYLQIAQIAEDSWEGKREKTTLFQALNAYEDIAKNFSLSRAWALLKEAEISIKGRDFKRAEEIAKKFHQDFPFRKGEACYLLSEVYKEEGEYQKSLDWAREALKTAEKHDWFLSRVKLNEAYSLEYLGRCEEAIDKYQKLTEEHLDQRPLALLSLGGRYTDLGEYNSAIKIFEELIKEYKDKGIQRDIVAEAMWYMGRCYEHLFDFSSAMEAYFRLCRELSLEELETSMGKGWYQDAEFSIGYCYLQLQEYEKALNIWEQLLERAEGELKHIIRRLLSSYKNVIVPTNQQINKQQMEGKTKLLGPIYGIFMDYKMEFRRKDKILIVYGTQSEDEEENKACEDLAFKLKKHLGETLPCKKDTDVSPEEMQNKNLVLIGTPYSNKVLTIFSDTLPIKIEGETIKVANRTYKGKDIGVIMVVPHPLNKDSFLLLYSAFEPSLLRNILSIYHGNADYIVFSKQSLSDTNEPDPTKPALEEGYFLKRLNKWEASFSKEQYYKEVR